jgi:hypothetical protein
MEIEFGREATPQQVEKRAPDNLMPIALWRHWNQLPTNQLDSICLGEDAKLRQSLELS